MKESETFEIGDTKMFTAVDVREDAEIVILAPSWKERVKELRRWGRKGRLVCPECRQPVRVRAGEQRRRHFAHWHKADCTYGHDDPRVVRARVLFYDWLIGKFGEAAVSVEKKLEGVDLPRPVDLWVSTEKEHIAYWIFGKGMSPAVRDTLHNAFLAYEGPPPASINWLFIHDMLRADADHPEDLNLNTTERAFLTSSVYDACIRAFSPQQKRVGRTLHYLNPDEETLTTYRGLTLVHAPAIYTGSRLQHPLSEILVAPDNGEPVHPGEYEQLREYRKQEKEWQAKRKRWEQETTRPLKERSRQRLQKPAKQQLIQEKVSEQKRQSDLQHGAYPQSDERFSPPEGLRKRLVSRQSVNYPPHDKELKPEEHHYEVSTYSSAGGLWKRFYCGEQDEASRLLPAMLADPSLGLGGKGEIRDLRDGRILETQIKR